MAKRLLLFLLIALLTACSGELNGEEAPKPKVEVWNLDKQVKTEIAHSAKTVCWNDCVMVTKANSESQNNPEIVDIGKQSIGISFDVMEPAPSTINLINETTGEHIKLDSNNITITPSTNGETVYRLHFFWNGKGGKSLGESTYRFGVKTSNDYQVK
ncbi:hypothetical protein [Pseudalkalibacillus sp. JSM 102089]|uniref:hypothetical protein n=1 Tax=Pseudalkalibacillus sp. JSM 102089 TaxID=3229856 RepID=UPI0035262443